MPLLVRYCLLPVNPVLFLETHLPLLPVALQDTIRTYASPQERALRLAGKLLLQRAVAEFSGNKGDSFPEIVHLPGQKPHFQGLPLHFGIAHSGRMSAVALHTEQPVGLDIEALHPLEWLHFDPWLHESEKETLCDSPTPSRHFLEIWTRKEAILKATGSGINADFTTLDANQNPALFKNQLFYWQPLHLHPEYAATVAAQAKFPETDTQEVFF